MKNTRFNNPIAVLPINPHIAQQEINDFIREFMGRFQCYSAESFAGEYKDQKRARELFETYYELITEALGMSGTPGYERPAPTEQEIHEQITRQRKLKENLRALDESNCEANGKTQAEVVGEIKGSSPVITGQ